MKKSLKMIKLTLICIITSMTVQAFFTPSFTLPQNTNKMTNTKINPTIYPRKGSPPLKSPPQTLASPLPTLCSPLFSSTSQDTLFQYAEDAAVKSLSSVVSEINAIEAKVEEMDDDALSQLTQTLKSKPNTPLSFAAVREAS